MVEFGNGRVVAVELANNPLPAKRTTFLFFISMPTHMPDYVKFVSLCENAKPWRAVFFLVCVTENVLLCRPRCSQCIVYGELT